MYMKGRVVVGRWCVGITVVRGGGGGGGGGGGNKEGIRGKRKSSLLSEVGMMVALCPLCLRRRVRIGKLSLISRGSSIFN